MNPTLLWKNIRFLIERLSLEQERDDVHQTLVAIERDVEFRGVNLWVLICATVVASVGLNVNSTAVIIGAMLISPLMGPIIGIGVSLATYDLRLLTKSARNFGVAVAFSVATSAFYFLLSPLKEAQSELLARTSPTIWDVLIAFFGGLAGIIAATSREKKITVIAGVAIATALMPPLCTAGYGLARGEGAFFFGALYLFFINAVFISTAAYLIAQVLRFPNHVEAVPATQQRVRRIVAGVVIITVLPSVYLAWRVVEKSIEKQRIATFIEREFQFPHSSVVDYRILPKGDTAVLQVILVGQALDSIQIAQRQERIRLYTANPYHLDVVQAGQRGISPLQIRAAVLEDLYQKTEQQLQQMQDSLTALNLRLVRMQRYNTLALQIAREVPVLYPGVRSVALGELLMYPSASSTPDTLMIALVETDRPSKALLMELEKWLQVRTGNERLQVIRR